MVIMRKIFTSLKSLNILAIVFTNCSIIVAKRCDVRPWLNPNLFKRIPIASEGVFIRSL